MQLALLCGQLSPLVVARIAWARARAGNHSALPHRREIGRAAVDGAIPLREGRSTGNGFHSQAQSEVSGLRQHSVDLLSPAARRAAPKGKTWMRCLVVFASAADGCKGRSPRQSCS